MSPSQASAHILNASILERVYARGYLGKQDSPEASELRQKIVDGSRRALESQYVFVDAIGGGVTLKSRRYWDIVERTVQQNPVDAALGGDPSPANKVRAFLNVQYYKGGAWESRFEVLAAHAPE